MISAGGQFAGINKKDFFRGYSVPVNREIMRIYKGLDMAERLGSGVPRILASYSQRRFDVSKSFLRVNFQSHYKNISG